MFPNGYALEGLHTETGPGVLEAAIMVDESLNAADKATLFKTFSKVLFQKTIWWQILWLNGLKIIQVNQDISIYLCKTWTVKVCLAQKMAKLPKTLQYFVGGLQTYMREFSVMYAPTVNSYKKTCPGAWAPINMTWGKENRTNRFQGYNR